MVGRNLVPRRNAEGDRVGKKLGVLRACPKEKNLGEKIFGTVQEGMTYRGLVERGTKKVQASMGGTQKRR